MSETMKNAQAIESALDAYRRARTQAPAAIAMDVAVARYRAYFPMAGGNEVKRALARHHADMRLQARASRRLDRLVALPVAAAH